MYETSENYKAQVYQDSTRHLLKVFLDNIEVESKYIGGFKPSFKVFDNDEFSFGSVISRMVKLKIHKNALTKENYNIVRITTGIQGEEIPYGEFTIDDKKEVDNNSVEFELIDYIPKLNFDYNTKVTFPATLYEIAEDICLQAGLELGSASFLNQDTEIYVWDNTVTAREYISYIAEQSGTFACIGRDGKLYFRKIGEDIVELNKRFLKNMKWGDLFKISRIAYEDGVQDFKQGTTENSTVWINQDNMYINKQEQINEIYNYYKDFECYSFEGSSIIDPAIDVGDVIIIDEKSVIYQGELSYCGKFFADIKSNIKNKTKQESSTRTKSDKAKIKRLESKINQAEGTITLLGKEVTEHEDKLSEIKLDIDSITNKVENIAGITREVEGITKLTLEECMEGQLLELRVYGNNTVFSGLYPSKTLYPSSTLYPRAQTSKIRVYSEDLKYDKTIDLGIKDVLRQYEGVCDEYVLEDNKAQIIRRIGVDSNNNKYILENEIIEELEDIDIQLEEGTNYIEIINQVANMKAKYVILNDFTTHFATTVKLKTTIAQFADSINLTLSKKIDDEEIIAAINMAVLKIKGEDVSKEEVEKSIIQLITNILEIDADNFKLTKDGIVTILKGIIAGLEIWKDYSNGIGRSWLTKDFIENGNTYRSGLLIKDSEGYNTDFIFAGMPVNGNSWNTGDANLRIFHNGQINAKWFKVNGENGYFYVDYNSGRRAMNLNQYGIDFRLDDTDNGRFCSFVRGSSGIYIEMYSCPSFQIVDSLHSLPIVSFERQSDLGRHAYIHIYRSTYYYGDGGNYGYEIATKNDLCDMNLKENIKDTTESALTRINKIKFKQFDWDNKKIEKEGHVDIGIIAQQIKEIDENYVNKTTITQNGKSNEYYNINTLNMLTTSMKAVQELSKENKELKEENEKQNKMINFLINKLNCKEEFEEYMRGEE